MWNEDRIEALQHGTAYLLTDMKISLWESTIRIETTGQTVMQMVEVDGEVDVQVEPENDNTAVIKNPKIVGVSITLQQMCVKCDAPLMESNTDFVKCLQDNDGKICNTKQIFSNANTCLLGELDVKIDDEMKHFQIDAKALKQFFGNLSPDEMEDHLLVATGLIIKYIDTNIIEIKKE